MNKFVSHTKGRHKKVLLLFCAAIALVLVSSQKSLAKVEDTSADVLRKKFNSEQGKTRIIALMSPTCEVCQSGHRIMRGVFSNLARIKLKGYLVWLPILETDKKAAAEKQAVAYSKDPQLSLYWNDDKSLGNAFSKTLKLSETAWDVYLVYGPGKTWEDEIPPPPDYWMHQLLKQSGADQKLRLEQTAFQTHVLSISSTPNQ